MSCLKRLYSSTLKDSSPFFSLSFLEPSLDWMMVRSWLSWTGNDRNIQGPRSWSVTNLLLATFGRSSSTKKTREVLYITAGLVCNMYWLVFVKLLKDLFWLVTSTLTRNYIKITPICSFQKRWWESDGCSGCLLFESTSTANQL